MAKEHPHSETLNQLRVGIVKEIIRFKETSRVRYDRGTLEREGNSLELPGFAIAGLYPLPQSSPDNPEYLLAAFTKKGGYLTRHLQVELCEIVTSLDPVQREPIPPEDAQDRFKTNYDTLKRRLDTPIAFITADDETGTVHLWSIEGLGLIEAFALLITHAHKRVTELTEERSVRSIFDVLRHPLASIKRFPRPS